jgi:hypothetical protein
MYRLAIRIALATIMTAGLGSALACEFEAGKTHFADYAKCRYGEDSIQVVELPDGAGWEQCVYFVQAFRPSKLLAVTKMQGDREIASVNDRSQIGNPCYLTKRKCDAALEAAQNSGY